MRVVDQVYTNISKCSGCSACKNVCPFSAIVMVEDKKGFLYPVIDKNKCRDCGLCKSVCQTHKLLSEVEESKTFKFVLDDNAEIKKSQSGGAFTALSNQILNNQGVIYGCIYDLENHRAVHVRTDDVNGRNNMRGSKYIQSDIQEIYSLVEADLKDGKQVMFTGTPCQCDGISLYLEKRHINKENLLLVDIICHGVPSPELWRSNISWIENKYQGKITAVNFRNKKFGWHSHIETYNIGNKEYQSEIFKNIFYSNVCLRPSCYECDYASLHRKTDITIGDAWRSDNNYVTSNMGGESLIIVSSQKGMKEIEKLNQSQLKKIMTKEYLQPNLVHPTTTKENIAWFWKDYFRLGYNYVAFFYGKTGFINKAFKILRRKVLKSHG